MATHVKIGALDAVPTYAVDSTPQDEFPIAFPFWTDDDISVYVGGDLLEPTDYVVTGSFLEGDDTVEGAYGSGTVTLNDPVSNTTVKVDRMIVAARETDFSPTGPLAPNTLNSDLDKLTARDQDIWRWVRYALRQITDLSAVVTGILLAITAIQGQIASIFSLLANLATGAGRSPVDLRTYLASVPVVTGNDPAQWTDCSAAVRQALQDARGLKVPVDASFVRGDYFLDPDSPIIIPESTGWIGPTSAPNRLSYINIGGVVTSVNLNPGFTFVVDVHSEHRWVPKFAVQSFNVIDGMTFVGHGLLEDAAAMKAGTLAAPTDHAPLVVTDHKHDTQGNVLTGGNVRKAGVIRLRNMRATGVMQFMALGDFLPAEEPDWAHWTCSGQVTGSGDIRIEGFSGSPMKRALATCRITSGGMKVTNAQFIPPNWTGISQPNSGGVTDYALLKWFQQNGTFWENWHRAVGIGADGVGLRGFRYGWKFRAGAGNGPDGQDGGGIGGEDDPTGQDTGKINAARFTGIGIERVITLCDLDQYSYMHRVLFEGSGHFMDEDNLTTETGSVFEVRSHKDKAGAVDKAYGVHIGRSAAVATGAKYDFGGNIYKAVTGGVTASSGTGPTTTDPTVTTTDGTVVWQYRNAGFKAFGAQPFAEVDIRINCQEIAGRLWNGNVNDGHAMIDASTSTLRNWGQANGHHNDAAIYNPSPIAVFKHLNTRVFASATSKRVYDVADLSRLRVGGSEYFGYTLPEDGSDPPEILGNDPTGTFFVGKNCMAYAFLGDAGTDYDPDDEDDS